MGEKWGSGHARTSWGRERRENGIDGEDEEDEEVKICGEEDTRGKEVYETGRVKDKGGSLYVL